MPLYFDSVAPSCPISRDQPLPPEVARMRLGRPLFVRPTIPPAQDLASAISSVNIASSIVTALTNNRVINNVFNPTVHGSVSVARDRYRIKHARWVEQKDQRVRRRYKYYAEDEKGNKNKGTWVIMERIEKMVWYDRAWKSYLRWNYGDKGEGEPVRSSGSEE